MGWSFRCDPQSKQSLIADRVRSESNGQVSWTVLAYAVRGNNLWKVVERKSPTETIRYIALDLLGKQRGEGWGYKDMDESVHPYYYSCPLKYLDMAPPSNEEWRALVRKHHARKNQKLTANQIIMLTNKKQYRIVSLKPLRAQELDNGIIYRIPRSMLTLQEPAAPMSVSNPVEAKEVA